MLAVTVRVGVLKRLQEDVIDVREIVVAKGVWGKDRCGTLT